MLRVSGYNERVCYSPSLLRFLIQIYYHYTIAHPLIDKQQRSVPRVNICRWCYGNYSFDVTLIYSILSHRGPPLSKLNRTVKLTLHYELCMQLLKRSVDITSKLIDWSQIEMTQLWFICQGNK